MDAFFPPPSPHPHPLCLRCDPIVPSDSFLITFMYCTRRLGVSVSIRHVILVWGRRSRQQSPLSNVKLVEQCSERTVRWNAHQFIVTKWGRNKTRFNSKHSQSTKEKYEVRRGDFDGAIRSRRRQSRQQKSIYIYQQQYAGNQTNRAQNKPALIDCYLV